MAHNYTLASASHALYRLTTSSGHIMAFASGVCRLLKSALHLDHVVFICKNVNSYAFMKITVEGKRQTIKKGGISILTNSERDFLNKGREVVSSRRLLYPFVFVEILGTIAVRRSPKRAAFTDIEKRFFVALSEQISVALKVFGLFREQKKIIINYIKRLTDFLDQYVPTSYLHTKSILRLIKAVGKEMRLTEIEIHSLEYASLLHDAGKMHLPSNILKKQKPLTDEEYRLMKKHPRKGVEFIKDLDILKPAVPIILHHHERYDGKGYPSRLKGNQIPMGSRILAVLDAFDAMYFGRPYKKRKALGEIEQELRRQAGKQFDPKVVNAVLKVLRRKDIRKHLR